MSRITTRFKQVKAQNRAALIPFIMGGDPDLTTSQAILEALPAAGADLIEIGLPFSDPMADGPVIQAAGLRALKAGGSVKATLRMVEEFRKKDDSTPIILMGYYNPIYHFGTEDFCRAATKTGVDGVIIVDLPPEEEREFTAFSNSLDLVRLIAPPSLETRLPMLTESASGFVYYISVAGITGAKSAAEATIRDAVEEIRGHTPLPVAVGFGIKTPEQAAIVGTYADAVVVGSALVDVIAKAINSEDAITKATSFVNNFSSSLVEKPKAKHQAASAKN